MQRKSIVKKEIVFIINNLSGGGAERVISIISSYLANCGYDVTILMLRGDKSVYETDEKVKKIVRMDYHPHDAFEQIKYLRAYYKAHPKAVFISFLRSQNVYSLLAAIGTNTKLVFSERMTPVKFSKKNLSASLEFKLLTFLAGIRQCKKIVFQSNAVLNGYPKWARKKGIVIPNPLSDHLIKPYQGERKKNIVALGRLTPQKNYKLLIDAFYEFSKKHPDYILEIYGDGPLKPTIEKYSEKLGLNTKIILHGFCTDVHKKIVDAGMYVMSSNFEGLSNALLEALALGIPTICTDHPPRSAREYIVSYENGILTPVGNVEALYNAMCYISENGDKAEKMGQKATAVRNTLSSAIICEKWKNMFDEIFEKNLSFGK